jgi:hypothetical protein
MIPVSNFEQHARKFLEPELCILTKRREKTCAWIRCMCMHRETERERERERDNSAHSVLDCV